MTLEKSNPTDVQALLQPLCERDIHPFLKQQILKYC